MKNIKFDIYKSLFLLILAAFIYIFYLNSLNGRFIQFGENEIIDTKNGSIYEINYQNSTTELVIKPINK